jgi:hypothetical protein
MSQQIYKAPMDEMMPIFREQLATGQSFCFSPKGISMLPMLREGIDRVMLSPLPGELKKYDIPLYQRDDGKYVLHRIVQVGETYTCIGDNQFQLEPGIRQDQLIAVVTAFYRGERKCSVTAPSYWLYCRAWYHSRHLRKFYRRCVGWLKRKLQKKTN